MPVAQDNRMVFPAITDVGSLQYQERNRKSSFHARPPLRFTQESGAGPALHGR